MSEQKTETTMNDEQAADFAALQRAANEADAAQVQEGQPAQTVTVVPPLEQELAGMLKMVAQMLKPALPSVAELYTDETCDAVGNAVGAVCKKHGWLQGGIGGKYGEEIMCLVIVGPLAFATVQAAKKDLGMHADKSKKKDKTTAGGVLDIVGLDAQPASDAAGSKTAEFGEVIPHGAAT